MRTGNRITKDRQDEPATIGREPIRPRRSRNRLQVSYFTKPERRKAHPYILWRERSLFGHDNVMLDTKPPLRKLIRSARQDAPVSGTFGVFELVRGERRVGHRVRMSGEFAGRFIAATLSGVGHNGTQIGLCAISMRGDDRSPLTRRPGKKELD